MAIMIYYVFLYFIRRYARDKVPVILGGGAFLSVAVYVLWFPYKYEISSKGLYGINTYYRWLPYSGAMLLGAYVGMKREELKYRPWVDFLKLMVCLLVFYGVQLGAKLHRDIAPWQVVTLLPLMCIVVYSYKCCHAEWVKRVYQSRYGHWIIMFVGGLCLESYLIQGCLFTNKMNDIWPFNLMIIVAVILACSYLVRCASRFFLQTFQTEDYEWTKIFRI